MQKIALDTMLVIPRAQNPANVAIAKNWNHTGRFMAPDSPLAHHDKSASMAAPKTEKTTERLAPACVLLL